MDQNAWIMLLVGAVITAVVFIVGIAVYPRLKSPGSGSPTTAAIQAAIRPFLFYAICAAFKMNEITRDQLEKGLSDTDKKNLADSIYDRLPAKVGSFDTSVVKQFVSRQQFEQLVQAAYDEFKAFYDGNKSYFDTWFANWAAQNAPSKTGTVPVGTG